MKQITQMSAIAAVLGLAVVTPAAAQTAMTRAPASAMALSTPEFVKMASQSDQFEMTEGKLAEKAGSPALRKFGSLMIKDHTRTTEGLHAALRKAGMDVPPPASLTAEQKAMIGKLEGLSGAAFDKEYLEQAVMSHRKALALHEAYDKAGDTPPIVAASKEATPIVREHLKIAERLAEGKSGSM